MVRMLVDTSVWLSLARDPKDVALVGIIERMITDGLLTLIVPSIVLKEFQMHRERVALDYGKRLSAHFRTVKDAVEASGAPASDIEATLRFLEEVDQKSPARSKLATQTFNRIEKLLEAVPSIEPSHAVKMAVFDRASQRRAPFHQGENEAADAVIIEIYAECVRDSTADNGTRWMFVTRNTEHFSSGKGNEKNPHADYTCFSTGRSEYFISLPDALRNVEPTVVAELMRTWELEQPTIADLIERFIEEAPSRKPLGASYSYALKALREKAIARKIAAKLQPKDIIEHCRVRREIEGAEPTTIRQDMIYLRNVLNTAEKEWEVFGVSTDVIDEALREVEKLEFVGHSYALRGRRPTSDEIQQLMELFRKQEQNPRTKVKMLDLVEFALASGRRTQEIHNLRWHDFNEKEKTCVLRGKTFPLSDEAIAVILRQPQKKELIFATHPKTASARFTRAKHKLKIKGLRFLDLRREAVMRMLAANVPLDRIEAMTGLGPLSLNRYREEFARGDTPRTIENTWKRTRKLRFTPRS